MKNEATKLTADSTLKELANALGLSVNEVIHSIEEDSKKRMYHSLRSLILNDCTFECTVSGNVLPGDEE
jgi:hypothetical protein